MRAIIAGCGRVGTALATVLDADGHDVAVIDQAERAFRRLPADFGGRTLVGVVFDRATMERAGAEGADAFVAVTNGDNSNVVAARTAREHFGVATVVARIYDPARADIYERHGITTIATAQWTIDAILSQLLPGSGSARVGIGPGEGDVVVVDHDLPVDAGPWEVESFNRQGQWLLAASSRAGQTTIPVPRQLLMGGTRVHLAVQRSALAEVEAFLTALGSDARDDSRGAR